MSAGDNALLVAERQTAAPCVKAHKHPDEWPARVSIGSRRHARRHRRACFSGGIANMTHAADCAPSSASTAERSVPNRSRRRERSTNVGYILFVFGALWVMAIAGMMAGAPK
jgi:hypothetical protein